MAETNNVPKISHFANGRNLNEGSRSGIGAEGEILSEFFRRLRCGRETASGAGDVVVTFAVAFPNANYTVVCTGDPTSAPQLKAATPKATTGFTMTAAGAGPVDWVAIHDGSSD